VVLLVLTGWGVAGSVRGRRLMGSRRKRLPPLPDHISGGPGA
jgi:hypothetical protein